jgi:hypothetical protein
LFNPAVRSRHEAIRVRRFFEATEENMKRLLLPLMALALVTLPCANADVFSLVHRNSEVMFDTDLGATSWMVDSVDHLSLQAFWIRLNGSGPEYPLGNYYVGHDLVGPNQVNIYYQHNLFDVTIAYTLFGGNFGSGTSDLAESILIDPRSSAIDVHFFQYADFDLGGTPNDDQLRFPYPTLVTQTDGSGYTVSETVVIPSADHHEGDDAGVLIGKLTDAVPTTLDNLPTVGGPGIQGDVAWAFQWDEYLRPGQSLLISKDKHLDEGIPEPSTVLLIGIGLVGAEITRRRRKKRA